LQAIELIWYNYIMSKDYTRGFFGMYIPNKKTTICGYCSFHIFKDNEVEKIIKYHKGKPICAVCRIKKFSSFSEQIKKDKRKFKSDTKKRKKLQQENANKLLDEILLNKEQKL